MTPQEIKDARWDRWSLLSDQIAELYLDSRAPRGLITLWWCGATLSILLVELAGSGLRQAADRVSVLAEWITWVIGWSALGWPVWVLVWLYACATSPV